MTQIGIVKGAKRRKANRMLSDLSSALSIKGTLK